jgi:5-(carboxyamino)imidazole ribonucleotide synthase
LRKSRREGDDGQGPGRIESPRDAEGRRLPGSNLIYEGFVDFPAEFSVILVRGADGEVRFWDSPHNVHRNGILATSTLPAPVAVVGQVPAARALAARIAEALGYVGVMTCEFFATEAGPVFNEMAPRVHNSGHWTIEGAETGQFENHIRAVCGLPLGDTRTTASRVEMENLLGREVERAGTILAEPGAHLHLYGKREAREGRKMGHVTRIGR